MDIDPDDSVDEKSDDAYSGIPIKRVRYVPVPVLLLFTENSYRGSRVTPKFTGPKLA